MAFLNLIIAITCVGLWTLLEAKAVECDAGVASTGSSLIQKSTRNMAKATLEYRPSMMPSSIAEENHSENRPQLLPFTGVEKGHADEGVTVLQEALQAIEVSSHTEIAGKGRRFLELVKQKADDNRGYTDVAVIVDCVIGLVFAYLYKQKVVDDCPVLPKHTGDSKGKDFPKGLFQCCGDMHLCLHLFCCLPCRAAHTWHVAQVLDYWIAVFVQIVSWPLMSCVCGCYLRRKIREQVGLENDGCMDCLKYTFCLPCALGQDAMLVDDETGVKVECCFKLTKYDT